jgi:hypothetical protein
LRCDSRLALLAILMACGDAGPDTGAFDGTLWRLTSVGTAPLPAPSTAEGQTWVAAVLQFQSTTGVFDRCLRPPSSDTPAGRSTYVVIASLGGDKVTVSYFDRRSAAPDTATITGGELTLRYTSPFVGGGVDMLTFVPLTGALPPACSLAP